MSMAAGLLGVCMASVKARLAQDYNIETEHVHRLSHREMVPTVQETHLRQDNVQSLHLVVIGFNMYL